MEATFTPKFKNGDVVKDKQSGMTFTVNKVTENAHRPGRFRYSGPGKDLKGRKTIIHGCEADLELA